MKKNGFLAIIAMTALSFAACNKEGLPQNDATDLPSDEPVVETPVVLEPGVYPATIVAEPIMPDLAGTKAVFDNGAFTWEAGDAIACFQKFTAVNSAETNVLTFMSTSGDGNFSGELPYTETESDGYYMNFVYPSSVVEGISSSHPLCAVINIPAVQDGRLENLGDYFVTFAYNVACTPVVENDAIVSVKTADDVSFSRYAVVGLKVNVPEAYGAQSLKIIGFDGSNNARGIVGRGHLNVNNRQLKNAANLSAKSLEVRHSDQSPIVGDTYSCIFPYGQSSANSNVEKLQFVITNENGNTYTFAKSVSALVRGTIYDLGSFPTSCVTPKISMDEDGAVVMTTSPAEAKIYYTTDGTEPSAESALYEGPVSIVGDTQVKAIAICEGLGNSAVADATMYSGTVAPVLKISESGFLTVDAVDGHTYKYSYTTDGTAPADPETELDPSAGIDIHLTGSYKIKVSATNVKGTAVTNGYYRVYYLASALSAGTKVTVVANGGTDDKSFAPFTVKNNYTTDISITRGTNGVYWKFYATGLQENLEMGLMSEYASDVDLYVFSRTADRNIYAHYDGVRNATTADGIFVPGSLSKTVNGKWTNVWGLETLGLAGKRVHFRINNNSELRGWGVLEQGFESFNPAAASVSNEAPVPGQNVAY